LANEPGNIVAGKLLANSLWIPAAGLRRRKRIETTFVSKTHHELAAAIISQCETGSNQIGPALRSIEIDPRLVLGV